MLSLCFFISITTRHFPLLAPTPERLIRMLRELSALLSIENCSSASGLAALLLRSMNENNPSLRVGRTKGGRRKGYGSIASSAAAIDEQVSLISLISSVSLCL